MRQGILAAVALLATVVAGALGSPSVEAGSARGPNVLLILTDDQRLGTMPVMPETRSFFRKGMHFRNAFATTPQCCPSRASIFSGKYAHNHGVRTNGEDEKFDPEESWPRLLDEQGYRTGIFGKVFNRTNPSEPVPNFDQSFVGFDPKHHRQDPNSSEFVVSKAIDYLDGLERNDRDPWAIEVAMRAPHVPLIYPKKYENFKVPRWKGNPATRERSFGDKHPGLEAVMVRRSVAKARRKGQLRMLAAADDALKKLYRELRNAGELDETVVIFTSDNGYYWGEHRLSGKVLPYLDSMRVPLLIRGPDVPRGTDQRIVANIDIAPTILDAAGIPADYPIDGMSVFGAGDRDWLLLEGPTGAINGDLPIWRRGYLSATTHYFEWADGRREYYDLTTDPWELKNLLGDASDQNDPGDIDAIADEVDGASNCAGANCP